MKTHILYICDEDQAYLNRLDGFLQHQKKSPFQIKTYTNPGEISKAPGKEGVLLVNAAYLRSGKEELWGLLKGFTQVVFLDEGERPAVYDRYFAEMGMSAAVISKFQSAKNIYTYLLEQCAQPEESLYIRDCSVRKKEVRITGIYTSEEKELLHLFALDYAKKAAAEKECLYISFEEFAEDIPNEGGLSALIGDIKEANKASVTKVENCTKNMGNLYQLSAPACPYDLKEVGAREWCHWLKQLVLYGRYEEIVINFGNLLPDVAVLELCTAILLPCTSKSEEKCRRYKVLLEFMAGEDIGRKVDIYRTRRDSHGLF